MPRRRRSACERRLADRHLDAALHRLGLAHRRRRSSPPSPPLALVTGARNSSTRSPSAVLAVALLDRRRRLARQVAQRAAGLREHLALGVADQRARPRRTPACAPPAFTAPSRNCSSSGLSSVRTPYLALKARLLGDVAPALRDLVAQHLVAGDAGRRRTAITVTASCDAGEQHSSLVRIDLVLIAIGTPLRDAVRPPRWRVPLAAGEDGEAFSSCASRRSRSTRMISRSSSLATPRM